MEKINFKKIGLRPELEKLLDSKGNITKKFCKKFLDLLPDEDEIAENSDYPDGMTGDGDDYMAWGYALTGDWVEMEVEAYEVWEKIEEFGL